jgi:hypothetical protein
MALTGRGEFVDVVRKLFAAGQAHGNSTPIQYWLIIWIIRLFFIIIQAPLLNPWLPTPEKRGQNCVIPDLMNKVK